jgi:hypothetical protein
MISQADFYGGADIDATLSASRTLVCGSGRVQALTPQFAGIDVSLPDARTLRLGGPHFYVLNLSGSYSLEIRDADGALLETLAANKIAGCHLVAQANAAGAWIVHVRALA